jgi:hypothetical protein
VDLNWTNYLIETAVVVLAVVCAASIIMHTVRTGISPMPTSAAVSREIFTLLPKDVPGVIYELGVGWGTLLAPLGQRYSDNKVVGYEISPVPWLVAKVWLKLIGQQRVEVRRKDFYLADLSDAGLVVCYLFPDGMKRLKSQLERQLAPGSWVMSNTFAIPGWTAIATTNAPDVYRSPVYLYRMPQPAKAATGETRNRWV